MAAGIVGVGSKVSPSTTGPRLHFELALDREGNASGNGERIGRDERRAEIAKLKQVTSSVFRGRINAASNRPIKHAVPVLDVLDEVGDIDYRVLASNVSADERQTEKQWFHSTQQSTH